jgi:hypothetical protein
VVGEAQARVHRLGEKGRGGTKRLSPWLEEQFDRAAEEAECSTAVATVRAPIPALLEAMGWNVWIEIAKRGRQMGASARLQDS